MKQECDPLGLDVESSLSTDDVFRQKTLSACCITLYYFTLLIIIII